MKTLILQDSHGQAVSTSTLRDVTPIAACDVDHSVSTEAREAKPFIQTILDNATEETGSFELDAPLSLRKFITDYCQTRGVRVAFSVGPHTHKVYATVQAVV